MGPLPRHSALPSRDLEACAFPESIDLHPNAMLFISEDNIVVIEDVRH